MLRHRDRPGQHRDLKATEPNTYWQTPHYEGWPAILVRYDAGTRSACGTSFADRAIGRPLPEDETAQTQVRPFASYMAIDWSGAKGKRHKGIAIAEARGDLAPRLVRPGHVWSRHEVLLWLLKRAAKEPTLFGFDFSFAPPIDRTWRVPPG